MRLLFAFILFLFIAPVNMVAQDAQFSQFYSAPVYLNPAFVGVNKQHRIIGNYRNQWPEIPGAFVTYNLSYDMNISDINSGVGFMLTRDKIGSAGLSFTRASFQYAYQIQIRRKYFLRMGMDFGYVFRNIDRSQMVFGDQLIRGAYLPTVEFVENRTVRYVDISSGILLYSAKFWAGMAFHHMNTPNQSLIGENSPLPLQFSMQGGMKIRLDDVFGSYTDNYLYPAIHYKAQGKFDQIDVGLYYERNPFYLGLWYRGIPVFKQYEAGYRNDDAVILLVGVKHKDMQIGYSYDITVSRLVSNTGGAHEISISYEFAGRRKPLSESLRNVPCPKF